ncbi:flavin reductase family protein [Mesorhizobium sp. 2RAF21]|uniref:flavin reductase family protein n=1 Tax=Mesorhizobium sp. 2RAF21 TaxID=3232995 RepID=UPI003F978430
MLCPSLDARTFRDALGFYASGITVISTVLDGAPIGFTCQSFYSVSIDPPLVSFSVMRTSSRWPRVRSTGKLAINVLSSHQAAVSTAFGRGLPDMWSNIDWITSPEGNPFLDGALLSLDCRIHAEHEAGDHWIVVAEVLNLHHDAPAEAIKKPLLYYKGRYHELAMECASS